MGSPVEGRVGQIRLDRRALRTERARVAWWRRLVRARMDLLVAASASPGPLGEEVAFRLPLSVEIDVPRHDELGSVLTGTPGHLADLDRLRDLDTRLARYESGVQSALDGATHLLIARLASDPSLTLTDVPSPVVPSPVAPSSVVPSPVVPD